MLHQRNNIKSTLIHLVLCKLDVRSCSLQKPPLNTRAYCTYSRSGCARQALLTLTSGSLPSAWIIISLRDPIFLICFTGMICGKKFRKHFPIKFKQLYEIWKHISLSTVIYISMLYMAAFSAVIRVVRHFITLILMMVSQWNGEQNVTLKGKFAWICKLGD